MSSPTQRTLAACRERGFAQVVERWVPQSRRRIDLFGCIDVVALDRMPGVLGIQATSASNAASRCTKIATECAAAASAWLRSGARLEVWGWRKRKKPAPGSRKLWVCNVFVASLSDGGVVFERKE